MSAPWDIEDASPHEQQLMEKVDELEAAIALLTHERDALKSDLEELDYSAKEFLDKLDAIAVTFRNTVGRVQGE